MRLVTFDSNGAPKPGAWVDDRILDLGAAQRALRPDSDFPSDVTGLLVRGLGDLPELTQEATHDDSARECWSAAESVRLLPPIPRPGKILAIGKNYADHAAETGTAAPEYPMVFFKPSSGLIGAGSPIQIPSVSHKIDYEGELAVVIGQPAKNVSVSRALDYVAGYTIANDVTARDLQRRTSQFAAGKMLDTFAPLGPCLVTKEEAPDPQDLSIRTRLNGRLMQDGHTSAMIFDVATLVSYLSELATLEVGDVILTGTPEGVGYPRTPPVYLQDSDQISVEIEGLGTLTNPVRGPG